jgi:hypothetical protein
VCPKQTELTLLRVDVLKVLDVCGLSPLGVMTNAEDLDAIRRYVGKLRRRYEECAQRHASLIPPDEPPYCMDCAVDDEHREEWEADVLG